MKTPDEIKKGLETCSTKKPCTSCPMWDECKEASSLKPLWDNALAYIQQLETENHQLLTKVEQLQRERDAAVNDIYRTCASCKHSYLNNPVGDRCPYVEQCGEMYHTWEWRGVKEE